ERLVQDHPQATAYRVGLANAYSNLGLLAVGEDRGAAAAYLQMGESILTTLTADHPDDILYLAMLGDLEDIWAILMDAAGSPAAAVDHYTRAVRALEAALQQEPRFHRARNTLSHALSGRAQAYHALKRDAEAANDWERALQLAAALPGTMNLVPYAERAA